MTNNAIIKLAKEIVKEIYEEAYCYEDIAFIEEYSAYNEDKYRIINGAFRSAIIPRYEDFIIKTPLGNSGSRQCNAEVENYFKAKKAGLSHYFAKYYGSFCYNGLYFYVFKKVPNIGIGYDEYSTKMSEYAKRKGLEDFLYDNGINDLHYNNYGKIRYSYIITDYAGVEWNDWD